MAKYDIILADPPWVYADRRRIRKDGKVAKRGIGAASLYPVMSTQELCQLSVASIAADNSALFLWATWPRIDAALDVMRAWGFAYKTVAFVWVKTCLHGATKPFFGVGYYSKSNTEPLLLGIRGRMKPVCNSISQVIMEPHPRDPATGKIIHSRKPASVRNNICLLFEGCMTRLNKLELFATEKNTDWDTTGYAVDGLDVRNYLAPRAGGVA